MLTCAAARGRQAVKNVVYRLFYFYSRMNERWSLALRVSENVWPLWTPPFDSNSRSGEGFQVGSAKVALFHFTVVFIKPLLKLPSVGCHCRGHSIKGFPFCERLFFFVVFYIDFVILHVLFCFLLKLLSAVTILCLFLGKAQPISCHRILLVFFINVINICITHWVQFFIECKLFLLLLHSLDSKRINNTWLQIVCIHQKFTIPYTHTCAACLM